MIQVGRQAEFARAKAKVGPGQGRTDSALEEGAGLSVNKNEGMKEHFMRKVNST